MPFKRPAKLRDGRHLWRKGRTAHARLARTGSEVVRVRGEPSSGEPRCLLARAPGRRLEPLPRFPSAPGEESNKSCPSHFITLLARADPGLLEPGPALASPRLALSLCASRATESLRGPG